jgi:signal peptidase I
MAAPWYSYWLGHPFRTLGWAARAVAAVHVFMEYCYDTPYAWGPSMLPTLEADNTWLLQSRWHSRGRGVEVGDLVSYKIPIFENHFAIKRVLGMPGDYVLTGMPGHEHQEMIQVGNAVVSLRLLCPQTNMRPRCRRDIAGLSAIICPPHEIRASMDPCLWHFLEAKYLPVSGLCGHRTG